MAGSSPEAETPESAEAEVAADVAAPERRRRPRRSTYDESVTGRAEEALRQAVATRAAVAAAEAAAVDAAAAEAATSGSEDGISTALAEVDGSTPASTALQAPVNEGAAAAFRRRRGPAFWLAVGWLGLVVFAAIFARWLPIANPNSVNPIAFDQAPTWQHWFGTDQIGHDLFSQVVNGAGITILIGAVSVTFGIVVGGGMGLIAGYYRGILDVGVVWMVDVLLTLPGLVLLITLVTFLGNSAFNLLFAIALLSIPAYARVARGASFAIAQREFVLAGLALGARPRRILWREVAPLVALPILSYTALGASVAILAGSALAFLGIGPQEGWGYMIGAGQQQLSTAPQVVFAPTIVLFLTILALNFLGQRTAAALDPRQAAL